jgi:hypothetical protein
LLLQKYLLHFLLSLTYVVIHICMQKSTQCSAQKIGYIASLLCVLTFQYHHLTKLLNLQWWHSFYPPPSQDRRQTKSQVLNACLLALSVKQSTNFLQRHLDSPSISCSVTRWGKISPFWRNVFSLSEIFTAKYHPMSWAHFLITQNSPK